MIADVAIIGAGPAGLSTAIQAARQGRSNALFERDRPGGQVRAAHWIENLPGFPEGISGGALAERLVRQAAGHGVEVRHEAVLRVARAPEGFSLRTDRGAVAARALIVACGLVPKPLCIPGAESQAGRRLFAYVDPSTVEHAGLSILVIGGGDAAFDQALHFAEQASTVTIAMRSKTPRCIPRLAERAAAAGIEILRQLRPCSIEDEGTALRVAFDGEGGPAALRANVVLACIGKEARLGFLPPELREPDTPGIFWAGDCARGRQRHVAIAMGDGVAAAMAADEYLGQRR